MPCYQSTTLPSGVTTTGRTSYATEAECLQACQEGACCEGTTCTVKPQCQCQCTTGRCCGPDTITAGGTTWKTCRNETKTQCDARGGVFQCGASCASGVLGDAAGTTGGSVCLAGTGDVANAGPVFKGVGTTCTGTSGYCCGPGTWSATDIGNGQESKNFSSPQTFLQCRSGFSQAGPAVTTQSGCEAIGGQWVTSPCVSCWEVVEKTGIGGSFKLVCYPSPNPLP